MRKGSKQKDAIIEYFKLHHDHPSAKELHAILRKSMPNVSLATVYRNLDKLVEVGILRRVGSVDEDRFDYIIEPHSHAVCLKCGKVIDFTCGLDWEFFQKQLGDKFRVSDRGITIEGLCHECAAKNASK